jgi:hypothetical protein
MRKSQSTVEQITMALREAFEVMYYLDCACQIRMDAMAGGMENVLLMSRQAAATADEQFHRDNRSSEHKDRVMPGPSSDVDLRMHPASLGPSNGFDTVVAASGWGVGESDYVIGNFHNLAPASWDVGVVKQTGYVARLVAGDFRDEKKLVLVR